MLPAINDPMRPRPRAVVARAPLQASLFKLLLALLMLGAAGCRPRLEAAPRLPSMTAHTIVTADGWKLGAIHLPPLGAPLPGQAPVILCHGTASNIANVDLLEQCSLGRDLARAGFDVWMVELRGGPLGARKRANGRYATRHFHTMLERGLDWDFDTHVEADVPAIVAAVQRWSGQDRVHWVGHSLGGMLGWAAEIRGVVPGFRSIVGIGSPGSFGHPSEYARAAPRLGWVLSLWHGLPMGSFARVFSSFAGLMPPSLAGSLMNPDNVDPDALALMGRTVLEDSPPGLMRQYMRWIERGEITNRDGSFSYTRNLERIQSPLAVLSGRADGLAPAWTVRPVYEHASSPQKAFRVFGVAEGDHIDYGHFDLVLGKYAPVDVFPWIREWLMAH